MNIEIEYEAEEKLEIAYEDIITTVVKGVLAHEKCPYEAEVNVLLADDEEIKELNSKFRYIDNTTDVLSFPMVNWDRPVGYECLEDELSDFYFHPGTGDLLLGDIAISVQKVKAQAESYGHSQERELGFLVAHSMLHLLGYDHIEDGEREVMEQKQRDILSELGINR